MSQRVPVRPVKFSLVARVTVMLIGPW